MLDKNENITKKSVPFSKIKIKEKFIYETMEWIKVSKHEARGINGGCIRFLADCTVNKI